MGAAQTKQVKKTCWNIFFFCFACVNFFSIQGLAGIMINWGVGKLIFMCLFIMNSRAKNCYKCGGQTIGQRFDEISYFIEMEYYKQYKCIQCKCLQLYCILCKVLMNDYVHNHNKKYHSQIEKSYPDTVAIWLKNRDYSSKRDRFIITSTNKLFVKNTQLLSLRLDKSTLIVTNCDRDEFSEEYYETEIRLYLLKNNYSCRKCGMHYETFPTRKTVHKHLMTCYVESPILEKLNS